MITEADYKARPGDRLLALLAERQIDPHDFAVEAEMSGPPITWSTGLTEEAEHRRRCYQRLIRYTRADKRKRKSPSPATLCKWAEVLEVDPGYFTSPG